MMKYLKSLILLVFILTLGLNCIAQKADKPVTSKKDLQYIDSDKPTRTPKIFASSFISKKDEYEYGSVFSKNRNEFFYAVNVDGRAEIRYTKLKKGKWIKPKTIISHKKYSFNDPFLSPDEDRLYYISDKPLNKKDTTNDYDIWFSKRKGKKWSKPINVGTNINSEMNEYYISFASDGTMYFGSNKGKTIKRKYDFDIYRSKYIDGKFQTPVKLSDSINTRGYEADVFISPDESYIIFSAARRSGFGGRDLYISFKDANGNWTKSKNMGALINTKTNELCPFVTADRKYFFYTSKEDIYWVSTDIFESLK